MTTKKPYHPPTLSRPTGGCDTCGSTAEEICVDCFMDHDAKRFVCATTACRDGHEEKRHQTLK